MNASSHLMEGSVDTCLALAVPKLLVKVTKVALEAHGLLDKANKIRPLLRQSPFEVVDGNLGNIQEGTFVLPLNVKLENDRCSIEPLSEFVDVIGIGSDKASISLVRLPRSADSQGNGSRLNLLASTLDCWIRQICPCPGADCSGQSTPKVLLSYNWFYTVYPPLLLLPSNTFSNLSIVLTSLRVPCDLSSLYPLLCKNFKITHIALNAPIPESIPKAPNTDDAYHQGTIKSHGISCDRKPNILRSPTCLTPLCGDFGPNLAVDHAPNSDDFSSALWCNVQQNGIFQTWAPRYTMFSRGNISEKARILKLDSLTEALLRVDPQETSAVDLYAGIGYFAFSYAKAGVAKILCWEINPWSVEGLRRGARKNKWAIQTVENYQICEGPAGEDQRFLIFEESNEHAALRVNKIRHTIPPIRHVNCGLLPSSNASWDVAIEVLDKTLGGWVHVHENIAKKDMESRKNEIIKIFTGLVSKHCGPIFHHRWRVECERIVPVKSYAPEVIHCVLDIATGPMNMH